MELEPFFIELELSSLIVFERAFLICETYCSFFLFSCLFVCRFHLRGNAVFGQPTISTQRSVPKKIIVLAGLHFQKMDKNRRRKKI